jgi:ATP-dependent helicase HepA
VNVPGTAVGAYWVEIIAVLNPSAPPALQLYRYLPATPTRICLDAKLQVFDDEFTNVFKVKPKMANQLITALATPIASTIEAALAVASDELSNVKKAALANMEYELDEEINRLTELKRSNPSIRQEEIDFIVAQRKQLVSIIHDAEPILDSVRVVVNNPK